MNIILIRNWQQIKMHLANGQLELIQINKEIIYNNNDNDTRK